MTEKKIVEKARKAKTMGYTHIASIVKSHYNSKYYNVVSCDDVIEKGDWISAPSWSFRSGAHGRLGTISSQIDWTKTIERVDLNNLRVVEA